ncbi:hypothetical protein D3C86_1838310 [compost metagenome]
MCLNSGATINPELETYFPFSHEDIKAKPAHLPSRVIAITASPSLIFFSRSSGGLLEIPVPRALADNNVSSQISFR